MIPDIPAAAKTWPIRTVGWAGFVLSVLLHLLVVSMLVVRVPPLPPDAANPVEVQVVPEPEPQAKPEPPPAPKPEPKPEPKVEPKPEPKPEPKAEQKPPPPKVEPAKPKPEPPPAVLQKPPAPVKSQASLAPSNLPVRGTPVAPLNLGEHGFDDDGYGLASGFDASTAQTIRDIMLTQVIRHWRPPPVVRGRHWGVRFTVEVGAGGMLGAPFAANKPLDITIAVAGYDGLPPELKQTLYDLVQALRVAQPFTLPAAVLAKAPFAVKLDFGFDQIP